jgi:hypothetical protein
VIVRPELKDKPYCGNCGYLFEGLIESGRCPECGKPVVETLRRNAEFPQFGKRYRSKATLFGLPVLDIALGPKNGELRGRAKGIIAIGDIATGLFAFGGIARGIVAFGGVSIGLFSIGGCAFGLLTAIGGFSIGALASGGGALGILANGGGAIGVYAEGGGAIGLHARGGNGFGSPAEFAPVQWFFGTWPPTGLSSILSMLWIIAIDVVVAGGIGLLTLIALGRGKTAPHEA